MTNAEARFNKIHIRKVYACLAVTCHLHFWQNDQDFLRATVVTRGWNGYRNKSQHRKSTLEKKILLPFQQGFKPATFQSRVRCSNHWAIPAPYEEVTVCVTCIYSVFAISKPSSSWHYTSLLHNGPQISISLFSEYCNECDSTDVTLIFTVLLSLLCTILSIEIHRYVHWSV